MVIRRRSSRSGRVGTDGKVPPTAALNLGEAGHDISLLRFATEIRQKKPARRLRNPGCMRQGSADRTEPIIRKETVSIQVKITVDLGQLALAAALILIS
jgi:hypothetical protein